MEKLSVVIQVLIIVISRFSRVSHNFSSFFQVRIASLGAGARPPAIPSSVHVSWP